MRGVAILRIQDPVSKMIVVREIQLLFHEALQCRVLRGWGVRTTEESPVFPITGRAALGSSGA